MPVAAASPLTGSRKKSGYEFKSLTRGRRAFKRQPQKVHSGQSGLVIWKPGEYGFVANCDAVRVGAHFGAPHPKGTADYDFVGVVGPRNLNVGALKRFGVQEAPLRKMFDDLSLAGFAIAVFSKPYRTVACGRRYGDNGVTHVISSEMDSKPNPAKLIWFGVQGNTGRLGYQGQCAISNHGVDVGSALPSSPLQTPTAAS